MPVTPKGEIKISPETGAPRLLKHYNENVIPKLMKEFNLKNPMEVPRLKKVVLNCAVKEAVANPKVLDSTLEDLTAIVGQKAVLTRSKKAIAGFKIREGIPLGARVTLRRARMYEFLDRMIHIALPRVRDFRGLSPKSFDGRGNYSLGIKEYTIFPEINYDKIDQVRGLTITIETSAGDNEKGRVLLKELGIPLRS